MQYTRKKAIKIEEGIYGVNSTVTAVSYVTYGDIYLNIEDFPQAYEYYNRYKKIIEETFGELHPDMSTAYNNLALTYFCDKKYEPAIKMFADSMEIDRLFSGNCSTGLAMTYFNLGDLFEEIGCLNKSLYFYLKAYKIRLLLLNGHNKITSKTLERVKRVYKNAKNDKHSFSNWLSRKIEDFNLNSSDEPLLSDLADSLESL